MPWHRRRGWRWIFACRRAGLAGLAAATFLLAGQASAADDGVSDWGTSDHSAARLMAAGPAGPGGAVLAGIEIRLDPGYITYWRNPGDAGVAPRLDTTGSDNVAAVTLDYPAPRKLDEGGLEAFGYTDGVILPLHVTRRDPTRPAALAVDLDYAVCAAQCLPARARLRLELPEAATSAGPALDAALAAVPRPIPLGAAGPVSITAVTAAAPDAADPDHKPRVSVVARVPQDSGELFVEAPEGWYLQAGPAQGAGDGTVDFPVAVLTMPAGGEPGSIDLRLTLVTAHGAIETTARPAGVSPTP